MLKGGSRVGQKITNKDIISFEMTVKFNYRRCDVILKKFNDIYNINIMLVNNSGYILEKEKTFIGTRNYRYLPEYLNDELANIEGVYKKLKKIEANFDNNLAFMG